MPTYAFKCPGCGFEKDRVLKIEYRDAQIACTNCMEYFMERKLAAPLFKIDGKVTPGGGPDKFTADALRIPLKDLPPGLRTPKGTT